MNDGVLRKLVDALFGFSDQELRELKCILQQPRNVKALETQIESILVLRNPRPTTQRMGSEESRAETSKTAEVPGTVGKLTVQRGASFGSEDLRSSFFAVLGDRDLFPSTRAVVHAVNSEFGCGFDYRHFKKRGRKDLLSKTWSYLRSLEEPHRLALLRRFFEKYGKQSGRSSGYQDLFKALTNHERSP